MQRLPEFRQFQRFERNFKAERVERVHNLRCRFDALIARRADNHCACDGNCIAERGDIEIQRAVVVHVFDRRAFKLLGEFREIVAVGVGKLPVVERRLRTCGQHCWLREAAHDISRKVVAVDGVGDGAAQTVVGEDLAGDVVADVLHDRKPRVPQLVVVVEAREGGGIGTAPLYPIVQALKAAGNKVIVVICARTKDLLIFVDEMKAIADEVIIMTDDGSAGRQGVSTVPVEELCQSQTPPAEVIAIGPPIMMKFVCATTAKYNVKTTVSLNTIMIDGTGMCGGCRVSVGGKIKFVCVDGPDFDGHQVDWANMMTRMKSFKDEEEKHKCRLGM